MRHILTSASADHHTNSEFSCSDNLNEFTIKIVEVLQGSLFELREEVRCLEKTGELLVGGKIYPSSVGAFGNNVRVPIYYSLVVSSLQKVPGLQKRFNFNILKFKSVIVRKICSHRFPKIDIWNVSYLVPILSYFLFISLL